MRILNLYAGLGGNRKLWEGHDITAVELDETIAGVYADHYPDDELIIEDAHDFLLNNHQDFDFVWSSPPCQTHSRLIWARRRKKPKYPDLSLYEEILLLDHIFEGKGWIVENVRPWYDYLIELTVLVGRHVFWSSFEFEIEDVPRPKNFVENARPQVLKDWLGIQYEGNIYYGNNHSPEQVLRNCVHPIVGKQILDAFLEN